MPSFELLKKLKNYYKKFTAPENEIGFDSLVKFPNRFFRLVFFDFETLSADANVKDKAEFYSKRLVYFSGLFGCVVGIIQVILYCVVHSTDFDVLVRAVSDALTIFLWKYKNLLLFLNADKLRDIIEKCRALFDNRKNEIGLLEKYFKGYRRIVKIHLATIISTLLLIGSSLIIYFISGSTTLVSNLWFPFDVHQHFPVVVIWELLLSYCFLTFALSSDILLFVLLSVISMEFDYLKHDLKNLNYESEEQRKEKVAALVDRHNDLFELSDKLQQVFGSAFLYNFITSSLIICFVSFHLMTLDGNVYLFVFDSIYLIVVTVPIWLLCFFGQKLIDSSGGVADRIYECDWSNFDDNELKKDVIIMILRAQRPNRLTAMGFADISLETFATVRDVKQVLAIQT